MEGFAAGDGYFSLRYVSHRNEPAHSKTYSHMKGLITCLLGVAVWFLVVDYPDKPQSFLKPDDYKFLSEVLRRDKGTIGYDEITWQKCRVYVWNWRNWV